VQLVVPVGLCRYPEVRLFGPVFSIRNANPGTWVSRIHFVRYVDAIALDSRNRANAAIKVLEKANERWPNQYDLLMTLVIYLEKAGDKQSIYEYLSALTAIAPNAPDVKQLVKKYSR